MRERTPAGTRLALVGLYVLALLAVVSLASRGRLGGSLSRPAPSASLLDYAFSIFLVAYVLALPFVVYALWFQRRTRSRGERRKLGWLGNLLTFLAFLLVAVAIAELRRSRLGDQGAQAPATAGDTTPGTTTGAQAAEPAFQWAVGAVTAAVVLAAAAGWWWWTRRRLAALREPLGVGEELALALDDAIDDVRAEADPRRAVIKAYARVETILAAYGLPRDPAETPYEFLHRSLTRLDASRAAVSRLTDLFERAKFSLHEIDPDMREDAIEALAAVRDELRGTAVVA